MGQIKYPQKREIQGPWIISQEDFESLHKIAITIDELLRKSWKNQIESEVYSENKESSEDEIQALIKSRENRTFGNKHEVRCELTSRDETKLLDTSVIGLIKDGSLKNFSPKEFRLNIVHGSSYENNFDLRVSSLYDGGLKYEIECFDSSIKDEIQYEIDKWIEKLKPKKLLQLWSNYGDFIAASFFIPLLILIVFSFLTSNTSYKDLLKSEAGKIISEGVNEKNRDTAIEILLKFQSGFVPMDFEKQEKPKNPVLIRVFFVGFFIFLISIIRPKTTLGLGKLKQLLFFYKFWIKLVTYTLPSILILTPFWRTITSWLY
jgi:hypothetical protein